MSEMTGIRTTQVPQVIHEDDDIIVTIRLLFKGKVGNQNQVGTIIGKKGSKLAQIKEESGCEVQIKGNQLDEERVVIVSGSPTGVTIALRKIAEFIEGDLNAGLTGRTTKIPVTMNLIVPNGVCGSIIGKAGSRIKEIRETTGCNIKIPEDLLPGSTEKLVTLYGEPTVIEDCAKAICNVMMEEGNNKRRCTPYIPESYGPERRDGKGGYGPGPGGYGYGGPHGVGGTPYGPMHGPPMHPGSGGYGRGYGGASKDMVNHMLKDCSLDCFTKVKLAMNKQPDGCWEVQIAKEMMGSVIGKGGSRISEIRALSTDIKIHNDGEGNQDPDSPVRRVSIQGPKELVDKAVFLLHVCVNVFTEPRAKVGHLSLIEAIEYAKTGGDEPEDGPMHPGMGGYGPMGGMGPMGYGYGMGHDMGYGQMGYGYPGFGHGRMPFSRMHGMGMGGHGMYGGMGGHGMGHGHHHHHHRGGYGGGSKKRPLMEPTTEQCDETPSQKRANYPQF